MTIEISFNFRCGIVTSDDRVDAGGFAHFVWSFRMHPDGTLLTGDSCVTLAQKIQQFYPHVKGQYKVIVIDDDRVEKLGKVEVDATSIPATVGLLNQIRPRFDEGPIYIFIKLPSTNRTSQRLWHCSEFDSASDAGATTESTDRQSKKILPSVGTIFQKMGGGLVDRFQSGFRSKGWKFYVSKSNRPPTKSAPPEESLIPMNPVSLCNANFRGFDVQNEVL